MNLPPVGVGGVASAADEVLNLPPDVDLTPFALIPASTGGDIVGTIPQMKGLIVIQGDSIFLERKSGKTTPRAMTAGERKTFAAFCEKEAKATGDKFWANKARYYLGPAATKVGWADPSATGGWRQG